MIDQHILLSCSCIEDAGIAPGPLLWKIGAGKEKAPAAGQRFPLP